MSRSDLSDVTVHIHRRTEQAVLVSTTGKPGDAEWFPLSQVELVPSPSGKTTIMTAPAWLLEKKEWA